MSLAVMRRISAMQSGELRFRIECEARKAMTWLQSAVLAPRWNRADLHRALRVDADRSAVWAGALTALHERKYAEAHRSLATFFTRRVSSFPVGAANLGRIVAIIQRGFPGAGQHAVRHADRILQGQYDLLGYRGVHVGTDPDWHYDPVHARRSPATFWAMVRYLNPAAGDHKIIWELNRHQHWLALARAHALCGDRRYYHAFTRQLASWLSANPPLIGTNWASMLELAFRTLSWMAALELFASAAGDTDDEPWIVDLLLGIDRQLTHIEHNLSHYFSPNTHLTGEALALYVGGLVLPQFKASARRTAVGRDVLVQEATRQLRSDGGHAELSTHYHRYSTDFYLLALAVARRAGDSATPLFEEAARRQSRYLRTIVDNSGHHPQIGDDDGGQLWPICGRDAADCRSTLATAAVLLHEPALAIGRTPEETYWFCGEDATRETANGTAHCNSAALPASGYYVSRTARGDHLIFDAGPHGFLNGGHAHADALSCTLSVNGRPLLVDPGTATYTMNPEVRDRFRSTKMHNTVTLDGRMQTEPNGPFHWKSMPGAHAPVWRAASDCDYMEGTHDAYAPYRHTRAILAIHGVGWWILDHVLGGGRALVESYWHFHPAWQCRLAGDHVLRLDCGDAALAMGSTFPLRVLQPGDDPLAVYSPAYGVVQPAPVGWGGAVLSLPATLATFVPATAEIADQLEIAPDEIAMSPGVDWHASAFRVRWGRGTAAILAAIERTGIARRDTEAPADSWGTAELRTDARLAVLIDHAAGRSEAILVNGASIDAHPRHRIVSLPQRVPLLRIQPATLAPSVHEVAATVGSPSDERGTPGRFTV